MVATHTRSQRIRKSPSGISVLVDPWAGIVTPEDFLLPNETVESLDELEAWEGPINRMLAASRVCAFNGQAEYGCSGDIVFHSHNVLYGNNGEAYYAIDSGEHSLFTLTGITNVRIYGARLNGNLQGTPSYVVGNGIQINNSSDIEVAGCEIYDCQAAQVQLYGYSDRVTVDGNRIHRTDNSGTAAGIGCASNHQAPSFTQITNNEIWGGTDGTDVSGFYGGLAILGGTSNFLVSGNSIEQCAQGFTCGYSGVDNVFAGTISNNNFYNCFLNGLYVTGGSPPGKGLTVTGNTFQYCGGGDANIGRASFWVGLQYVGVTGNIILDSGYTTAGVARGFHAGAIYSPQSAYGVAGSITGNVILHSQYLGIAIDGPNGLVISSNYAESQYPYSFNGTLEGPSMVLNCSQNVAKIYTGLVGDGFEFQSSAGNFDNLIVQGNQAIGAVSAGSNGFLVGNKVVGALFTGNHSKSCANGFLVGATAAEYLGDYVHIRGNLITLATNGVLVSSVGAGDNYLYVEANDYIACTNQVNATGTGAARVREAVYLTPRKCILGTAAPNAGAGDWKVGDQVLMTEVTGGVCIKYCSVAGNPGTWLSIMGV